MEKDKPAKIAKKAFMTLLIVSFFDLLSLTLFMLFFWILRLIPLSEISSLGHLNLPIFMSIIFSTITGFVTAIWTQEVALEKLFYGMLTTFITLLPLFILNTIIGGAIAIILLSLQ